MLRGQSSLRSSTLFEGPNWITIHTIQNEAERFFCNLRKRVDLLTRNSDVDEWWGAAGGS